MNDENYVDQLIHGIEARDQLIGALKNQVAYLERELLQYRRLESAVFEAVTPEEKLDLLTPVNADGGAIRC